MGKKNRSSHQKNGLSNGHGLVPSVQKDYAKAVDTFGSRKRHLENVPFVYPKNGKGNRTEYVFGKHHPNGDTSNQTSTSNNKDKDDDDDDDDPTNKSINTLSIDDILNGVSKKKTKVNSNETAPSHDNDSSPQGVTPTGHLSGKSVEEVIRDKAGCRPRANSTDGELALPQRGLCDERTVLTKYMWSSSYMNHRKQSKRAVGLMNLGNTVR